jgi:aspartyl-tRNA(Asn)/glutamyl-tRNA(Gln) amidotransferase subunit C
VKRQWRASPNSLIKSPQDILWRPIMESLKTVSKERIARLAYLARVELSEDEKAELALQLNRILDSFKVLDSVDLEGIEPTYHAIDVTNILREDKEEPCLSQQEALANAKKSEKGFFVAPKIV